MAEPNNSIPINTTAINLTNPTNASQTDGTPSEPVQQHAAVLGGDARSAYAAKALQDAGWQTKAYNVPQTQGISLGQQAASPANAVSGSPLVVGPVPWKDIADADILDHLDPGAVLVSGDLPSSLRTGLEQRGVTAIDLLQDEDFALHNAIATAEGAIAEALQTGNIGLHKAHCLVLGYGHCGEAIAAKLRGMGAIVTVTARRWEQAVKAELWGCNVVEFDTLQYGNNSDDYIFNTIPAPVITKDFLNKMNPDTVIIDIASGVGGTDFAYAQNRGIIARHVLGLPGKYAARKVGEAIGKAAQAVYTELSNCTAGAALPPDQVVNNFKGSLGSASELPTSGNTEADGYVVDNSLYRWSGTQWVNLGAPQAGQDYIQTNEQAQPNVTPQLAAETARLQAQNLITAQQSDVALVSQNGAPPIAVPANSPCARRAAAQAAAEANQNNSSS